MNLSFSTPKKPDLKARLALRNGKWKAALPFFTEQANVNEQNYAQWNLLGDIQYRAGDMVAALESWQKAMNGYAQESLHENVLGIGRKIAKRCPEETGVHRDISEALLGLEYFADAISSFRSFVKLAKHSSISEKKSWFRKIMQCEIRQPHLHEELLHIYEECGLEDIELQRDIQAYVRRMQESIDTATTADEAEVFETPIEKQSEVYEPAADGLISIESDWTSNDFSILKQDSNGYQPMQSHPIEDHSQPAFESIEVQQEDDLPIGQGKDHYDLGVVYSEMKLWDAAITEFQTARRDRSLRSRATIELANCLKNSNDPHRALRVLEEESNSNGNEAEAQSELFYHMGLLNEILGNGSAAKQCFEKVAPDSAHAADAALRMSRTSVQSN